jgi:hypothetical protein
MSPLTGSRIISGIGRCTLGEASINSLAIDSTTVWLVEALLPADVSEVDRLAVEQIKNDAASEPLDEVLASIQEQTREEPGQFGLQAATALLYPWLLPALHTFVKHVATKFFEGGATEAGKMTASALKEHISRSHSKDADSAVQQETTNQLERCLIQKAQELDLPKSIYEDFIRQLRSNPKILL